MYGRNCYKQHKRSKAKKKAKLKEKGGKKKRNQKNTDEGKEGGNRVFIQEQQVGYDNLKRKKNPEANKQEKYFLLELCVSLNYRSNSK